MRYHHKNHQIKSTSNSVTTKHHRYRSCFTIVSHNLARQGQKVITTLALKRWGCFTSPQRQPWGHFMTLIGQPQGCFTFARGQPGGYFLQLTEKTLEDGFLRLRRYNLFAHTCFAQQHSAKQAVLDEQLLCPLSGIWFTSIHQQRQAYWEWL